MVRRILGLDIGTRLVHLAELENIKGRWVLKGVESRERPSVEEETNWLYSVLNELKTAGKLSADVLVSNISTSHFTLRSLSLPFRNPKRIDQVIGIEMEAHLTMPIEEAVIDYTLVSEAQHSTEKGDKKGLDVFAFAVKEKVLEEHLALLSSCGLNPQRVVPDIVPLWRVALDYWENDSSYENRDEIVLGAIDIGFSKTTVAVIKGGIFSFARVIGYGMRDLFRGDTNDSYDVIEEKTLDQFIKELRLTLTSVSNYTGQERIHNLILGGGGANCRQLTDVLPAKLRQEVLVYEPGAGLTEGQKLGPEYLQAIGLALCEAGREKIGINLLKRYSKTTQISFSLLKRHVAYTCLFVVLMLGIFLFGFYSNIYLKQTRLKSLEEGIKNILIESMPGATIIKGNELRQFREKAGELEKRLVFFESLKTDFSPLEVLKAMSMHTSYGLNLDLNSVAIKSDAKPDSVTIEGEIATLDFDKLKRDLLNTPIFTDMRLEKTATSGPEGKIGFKVTLKVDQSAIAIKNLPSEKPQPAQVQPAERKSQQTTKKTGGRKKK